MKSILISGAASGIGAATVKKLASKNISFTLTTKTNEKGLIKVAEHATSTRSKGQEFYAVISLINNS